jgi:endonuclease YncB( thermonuclease family)
LDCEIAIDNVVDSFLLIDACLRLRLRTAPMRKNVRKQIRLSEELLEYINDHYDNASQFIREAIRDKVESEKQQQDQELTFVEIRARNQFTYSAKLDHVIDGDTLALIIDLDFYITINAKIRLADIDCPEIDSEKGQ